VRQTRRRWLRSAIAYLKCGLAALVDALTGSMGDIHRRLLAPHLDRIELIDRLASWIGVCPGSNESAGKNHSGHSAKGNRFLRRLLNQAAQAAVRTKNSHLPSLFKRLVVRLGYVKAVWAVAHRICKIIWNVLHKGARFIEFSEARNPKAVRRAINHHLKALRRLGYPMQFLSTAGS